MTAIDSGARQLVLAGGSTEPSDVCSIAVGSAASGMSLPGVADHVWPVEPLRAVESIGARPDTIARGGGGAVVGVGGGMAGVELALALRARATIARGARLASPCSGALPVSIARLISWRGARVRSHCPGCARAVSPLTDAGRCP